MYEKSPVTMNSSKLHDNLRARGFSRRTAVVLTVLIAVFLVVNVVQFAVRFGSSVSEQLDAPTEDSIALPYYELTADEQAAVDATGTQLAALKEEPSSSDLTAELAGWLEGRLRQGLRHGNEGADAAREEERRPVYGALDVCVDEKGHGDGVDSASHPSSRANHAYPSIPAHIWASK